jgi:hypothetical protein
MKNTDVKLRYLPFPNNVWFETFLSGWYLGRMVGGIAMIGNNW